MDSAPTASGLTPKWRERRPSLVIWGFPNSYCLETVTGAFELGARMAASGVLSPAAAITFELHKVDGGELIWPGDAGYNDSVSQNCWCPDAHVTVKRQMPLDDLQSRKRELALEASMEIYSRFGWLSPPKDRLIEVQNQKFGAARREP